jgi:hypothetical protein
MLRARRQGSARRATAIAAGARCLRLWGLEPAARPPAAAAQLPRERAPDPRGPLLITLLPHLRRGPCFQPPALTEEDRDWDGADDGAGGDSDDFEARAAARATAARAATAAAGYDSDSDGGGGGGKKQKAAAGGAVASKAKMTTSIRLLDPAALAAQARATAGGGAAGSGAAGKKRRKDETASGSGDGQEGEEGAERGSKRRAGGGAGGDAPAEAPEGLRGLPPLVQACMIALGHAEATPVQAAAWVPACGGRDVQAVAEPGSGKTLGYLLPAFMRIAEAAQRDGAPDGGSSGGGGGGAGAALPCALVLAPTRELAMQVACVARSLRGPGRAASAVVYGGAPREQQVRGRGCGGGEAR